MILIAFFTLRRELGRKLSDCWAAIGGSALLLPRFDGLNPSTCYPPLVPALLLHSGFTLSAASPWMYCMCPPEDIVGGGDTAQWFLSLKGDSTQIHSKPMRCFIFSFWWRVCGYCYITKHAEKQRSDLLTYDQTDADLSQAQHKSEYLKGLANDVIPSPTNSKGLID